ncbi:MAG: transposase [Chloroflexi bacterium]|nr:transposase [Chloroflexota bacterium]
MDEKHERIWRRKAIRLTLRGLRSKDIRKQIPRSRRWLCKWQARYQVLGWRGLQSESRHPHRCAHRYSNTTCRRIVCIRHQLEHAKLGWLGAKAIQRAWERRYPGQPCPSKSLIYAMLHRTGVLRPARKQVAYCPRPTATPQFVLHAMDWTQRYLDGGPKVYAFHTVTIPDRAIHQTISPNKRRATACGHLLEACQQLGLPDGLQLDNDAAFNGTRKVARVFSPFVRLALYLGIELIFIPFGEAERNGVVERLNGVWSQGFWKRRHFRSVAHVQRASPVFVDWYTAEYLQPSMTTPTKTRRLTKRQRHALPNALPITAGRIHFERLVDAQGNIALLNDTWHIDQRLAGQYV